MFNLPQITEDDVRVIDQAAGELIGRTEASAVLITDVGGALIARKGDIEGFDITSIAALASNSYAATQMIASLINEPNFTLVYQQGDNYGLLVMNVEEYCLLIAIFKASVAAGLVKYYAQETVQTIAVQMKTASERAPGESLDMIEMDVGDIDQVFKRKKKKEGEDDDDEPPAVPA
jgi:predicted regulator of Ras-like GTPase activity (Roadblock/LC7/MglB family)